MWFAISVGLGIAVVCSCVLTTPIDPAKTNAIFIADIPALAPLITQNPTFAGFHPDIQNIGVDILVIMAIIAVIAIPFFLVITCIIFYFRMGILKKTVSPSTYAVHKMLLRLFKFFQKYDCMQYILDGNQTINPSWNTVLRVEDIINGNELIYVTNTLILNRSNATTT
uniref:Transmembrane protein n=2 Tax=Panagrellus redivivus TaxID=6233 RepID=A0A7E4ZU17_PANRE